MRNPIIVLWTTPRSRSTAFERMMIERGDHTVLDEPFSARYYFSSERRSLRYDVEEPESTGGRVLERILSEAELAPVFVKDMAYHATGLLSGEFLSHFTNTFLIREPEATLTSFARKWPDFTDEEAGFSALGQAYDLTREEHGPPVVLDGDELASQPARMIDQWCRAVGIPFLPEALTWQPGMVPEWSRWQDWYSGVAESSGFVAPQVRPGRGRQATDPGAEARAVLSERAGVLSGAREVYRRLAESRLTP